MLGRTLGVAVATGPGPDVALGVGLGPAVARSCWTSWMIRLEGGAKCRKGVTP